MLIRTITIKHPTKKKSFSSRKIKLNNVTVRFELWNFSNEIDTKIYVFCQFCFIIRKTKKQQVFLAVACCNGICNVH